MPRKTSEWIESFEIFAKYGYDGGLIAEHDEVWGGPNPETVSEEDVARLDQLGWSVADTGNFNTNASG
jgi:hypothetical protein